MNVSLKSLLLLMLASTLCASCIRDELDDCPLLTVSIDVKDKNYFNVDFVDQEQRLPDTLAFRRYVPTLFYVLRCASTGEVVEERGVFGVEGDATTAKVEFCPCLPHGKYILTVWGGLRDLSPLSDDLLSLRLHPDNNQSGDIYLANDTLVYDAYSYNHTVEMRRTKGKLLLLTENLPSSYNQIDIGVDKLYGRVNSNLHYSGFASVSHKTTVEAKPNTKTETFMAPSQSEQNSTLHVNFFDMQHDSGSQMLSPANVRIALRRNEISVVKYVWDNQKNDFVVYMLVNDSWEQVHGMEID